MRFSRKTEFFSAFFVPITVCLLAGLALSSAYTSSISLEAGLYKNLLIAIHEEIHASTCVDVIREIENSIRSLSAKINGATDSKASIGDVKILLPYGWSRSDITQCGLPSPKTSKIFEIYDSADIKITSTHPIAKTLPWTKQYRGCGWESESIYIPPVFLSTPDFNAATKGNLLLHEWAKFRYGVFEEFGYFEDPLFLPCYNKGGSWHFVSCTDNQLGPFTGSVNSSSSCKTEINKDQIRLQSELSSATSSVMSNPNVENINSLCTSQNHNIVATTKQNYFCNRRSVSDVVMSHRDWENGEVVSPAPIINFEFLQRVEMQDYAFLIEDSSDIRDSGRLSVVQQAVTQIIKLLPVNTEVVIVKFNANVMQGTFQSRTLTSDITRIDFLNSIPKQDESPLTLSSSNVHFMGKETRMQDLFQKTIDYLKTRVDHQYNIIFMGSQNPWETEAAMEIVKNSAYSVSIRTFNESPEWLKWTSIPNTKDVIYLPTCEQLPNTLCNGKLSSLLTESLMEIVANSPSRRNFHKITTTQTNEGEFSVDISPSSVSNFFVVLPFWNDAIESVVFRAPSGGICNGVKLLESSYLLFLDFTVSGCSYQTGTWTITIAPSSAAPHLIHTYVETSRSQSDLVVSTSIGHSMQDRIYPKRNLTPVYVSVSSSTDNPVVDAEVTLELFSSDVLTPYNLTMLDNGQYPDVTENDGVYSAFLQGYSPNASSHLGQARVKKRESTRTISTLSTAESAQTAALLDPKLSSKCCGSSVPIGTTQYVLGNFYYSAFIPSFLTAEEYDSSLLPPSKIQFVATSTLSSTVILEFEDPSSVAHYSICCQQENGELCKEILNDGGECTNASGTNRTCRIRKQYLSTAFESTDYLLYCGIKGVNAAGVSGEISGNLVEIDTRLTEEPTCDYISDGCLPITIFWVLIGCVGGLLLIIAIISITWCIVCCRDKEPRPKKQPVARNEQKIFDRNDLGQIPDKDSPLYNVYVNQAYIQETDGQLKLVAAEGELLPYEGNPKISDDQGYGTQNSVTHTPVGSRPRTLGPPTAARRRSISANAPDNNMQTFNPNNRTNSNYNGDPSNSNKHVSWTNDDNRNFKPYTDGYREPNRFPPHILAREISKSEENIIITPKAKERGAKAPAGYANPNSGNYNRSEGETMTPVTSLSSVMDAKNRNAFLDSQNDIGGSGTLGPIYASVNRNGRRFNGNETKAADEPIFGRFSRPVNNPNSSTSNPPPIPNFRDTNNANENYKAPNPGNPFGAGRFSRANTKQRRLDVFPSSDSETYSDMSRGIPHPTAPPLPPPLPTPGDLTRHVEPTTRVASDRNMYRTDDENEQNYQNEYAEELVAVPTPTDNSFAGLRSHIEQQLNNKQSVRPPPPPRQDKLPRMSSTSNVSSVIEMGENIPDQDYDEGSDFWDDGDDGDDYNRGHSYA